MPGFEEIQLEREDSTSFDDVPAVGGPGGPSSGPGAVRGRRASAASSGVGAGSGPGRATEPGRPDRPQRKGSVRAGSTSGSFHGEPQTPNDSLSGASPQPNSLAQVPRSTVQPAPVAPQTIPVYAPQGPPPADLGLRLAQAERQPPRRYGATQPQGVTNMQRYQTALSNAVDPLTLSAIQGEQVPDPLLESLDPFLGKRPASPALGSLGAGRRGGGGGGGGGATSQFSQQELSSMEPDMLKALVNALAKEVSGGDSVLPERVDVSPPRTPPPATAARNPADIVGAVERREMERAARALLEENVENVEMQRQALDHFYATGQDVNFRVCPDVAAQPPSRHNLQAFGGSTLADVGRFDPAQMAQLQRAAKVDPFARRTAAPGPPAFDATRPSYRPAPAYDEAADGMFITRDFSVDEPRMPLGVGREEGPIRNVSPDPIHGASKSVLIGVGYVGTPFEIPEHNKNVHKMKAYLMEKGFFGQQLLLSDDSQVADTQPTYANILTAVRWLVQGAVPGNALFLYYSGRAQHRDASSDATDILPSDFESNGALPDGAITEIVSTLPAGVKLTILCDAYPNGQLVELSHKMIANRDGSFRVIEGRRMPCEGYIVQISGRGDASLPPEAEALQNLTQLFMDVTAGSYALPYIDVMLELRDGLANASCSTIPCVSHNRPVDLKNARFHLAAPQTTAEEDPRLHRAKQQTKDIAQEMAQVQEEKDAILLDNRERLDEWKKQVHEQQTEASRLRRLHAATSGIQNALDKEADRRHRIADEENSARHNLSRLKHECEDTLLRHAMSTTGWNRLAAPENTGLPVVVGVKWQHNKDKKDPASADPATAEAKPGQATRTFNVVPATKPASSLPSPRLLYGARPYLPPQGMYERAASPHSTVLVDSPLRTPTNRSQLLGFPPPPPGGGMGDALPLFEPFHPNKLHVNAPPAPAPAVGATLPLDDNRVVRWKRVDGAGDEPPQWIREEVPASAHYPEVPYP